MFVDFEGARGEERVDALMRALDRECNSMLVLDKREVREWNLGGERGGGWVFLGRRFCCVRVKGARGGCAVACIHPPFQTHIHTHTCTHNHSIRCRGSPATRSSSTPSPTASWTPARI